MVWLVANADRDGRVERNDVVMGRETGTGATNPEEDWTKDCLLLLEQAGLVEVGDEDVLVLNYHELAEERKRIAASRHSRTYRTKKSGA